jgi:hypothetical protein
MAAFAPRCKLMDLQADGTPGPLIEHVAGFGDG